MIFLDVGVGLGKCLGSVCFGFCFFMTKRPLGFEINALFTPLLAPTGYPIGLCLTSLLSVSVFYPSVRLVQVNNPRAQGREREDGPKSTD